MATAVEALTTLLTIAGIVYLILALYAARSFVRSLRQTRNQPAFSPPVSILKPLKGVDARMYEGFVSHCRQIYAAPFELVFGVHPHDDAAIAEVERLRKEFPQQTIKLVVCPGRLGTSGKVSNLVQMLPHAAFEHILINDSDILVPPGYLTTVMTPFADPAVGMVTAPYLGRNGGRNGSRNKELTDARTTLWARLESLGISTDFFPGVLTARSLEGAIRFGMGSTLALSKTALAAAGGLEPLVEYLADDYEIGKRIAHAGYQVELCAAVVETTVPAYTLDGFWHHQMRWARSTRDSRRLGYFGLGITYAVPWALMTVVASGAALWSFTLLALALLARVTVALTVGVGILRDDQVLRDLWLLPLRDLFGLLFWAWSFAGNTVVWRGETFHLREGKLSRL